MLRKFVPLFAVCAVLAFSGYQVSFWRAGFKPPVQEALAAAGADPALLRGGGGDGSGYHIWELEVFSDVVLKVNDDYVDPARIDPREMLRAALQRIEQEVAEVLVEEVSPGQLRVRVMGEEKMVYTDDVESLWEINLKLREVFRFLERHLPPRDDLRQIEYAAVNGALSTLDPHSVLLKPEAFAEMKTSTKGEFGGLGIVISIRDGKLTVMSPLDGTPASRAGIASGDVISRIGDVSTVSMSIEEAVQMLRGPEGSKVIIWVERESWPEARRFEITRERIKIESVESELLSENVGYIRIKNFQQNTADDLDRELRELKQKTGGKLEGLVLDLRNNPGGLLEQAIQVSDAFLSSGDIVTTVGYGNQLREPKRARWAGTETELPIAVIVNQGSASASEIVAGALKNLDRAVVVGERTFGKGSVQVLYDFADNSALKLTIAQYLTPGNISIQSEGVVPDIALRAAQVKEGSVRLFHRPEGHRESSLEKHLDRGDGTASPHETKARFQLTHLVDQNGEEPEDPNAFVEDYNIRFARELLTSIGAARRTAMLQRGQAFVDARRAEETRRIHAAIEELGLDWSDGNAEGNVTASIELSDGVDATSVTAGSEVELVVTVTNDSDRPIHRVHGVLDAEHPSFKGRELLFGKLEPGASRSWTVPAKIPTDAVSRSDVVALELFAGDAPLSTSTSLAVITRAVPHPQFAYTYVLDDTARGDGDGVLEVGEGIDLRVLVTNVGEGDANEVALHLKSAAKEKLFLERGRTTLGELGSGQTRVGTLKFRVPEGKNAADAELPLELTIYDGGTGEWVEDRFDLRAEAREPTPGTDKVGVVTAKSDALIYDRAAPDGRVVATLARGGQRRADRVVGDQWYRITLGEDAFGFLRREDAKWSKGEVEDSVSEDGFAVQSHRRPPVIAFSHPVGGKVVGTETFPLEGIVTGRELRDLYVLVNDEKVHFQSAPSRGPENVEPKPGAWSPPNDAAVRMPFSVELKLEEGLNRVLVVARLNETVVTYRSFFVSRRAVPPAVAERNPPSAERESPRPR